MAAIGVQLQHLLQGQQQIQQQLLQMQQRADIGSRNQIARALNSTALFGEAELRRVQKETFLGEEGEQPLGAVPAMQPQGPHPLTRQNAAVLTAAKLNQLQQFYRTPFEGGSLNERRRSFAAFIGLRL